LFCQRGNFYARTNQNLTSILPYNIESGEVKTVLYFNNTHKRHTVYRVYLILILFCASLFTGGCDFGLQAIIMSPGLSQITIQKCETVAFEGFGIGGFPFESDDSESGDSYGYYWDAEDNEIDSRTDKNIDITFKNEGTFTVSFTVTDKRGAQDEVETTVIVLPNDNADCESNDSNSTSSIFTATITQPTDSQKEVEKGDTINFVGEGKGGREPYDYSWYKGGALFSTEKSEPIKFNAAGDYTIKFAVKDSRGVTRDDKIVVTVKESDDDSDDDSDGPG